MNSKFRGATVAKVWDKIFAQREVFESRTSVDYYSTVVPYDVPLSKILMHYIEQSSNDAVVDLGCGSGMWLRFLANQFPQKQFFGIDFCKPALRLAIIKSRLGNGIPNVHFALGDIRRNLCYPKHVGLFMSLGVIEHFSNHLNILRNWTDRMEKGSYLLLTVPNASRIDRLVIDLLNWHAGSVFKENKRESLLSRCDERLITSIHMYEERWTHKYFDELAEELGIDLVEKFGLQFSPPTPFLFDLLPEWIRLQYFILFSKASTTERNGLMVGAVFRR